MKRWTMIIGIALFTASCSFAALYAGIQVGYALAVDDGRFMVITE
jgi:hypothetical protein